MRSDPELRKRLADMRYFANLAIDRTESMTLEEFTSDPILYEGFIRIVQNIGEAAAQLLRTHPMAREEIDLPWQSVIAMRNKVVHGYNQIVPAIVFATIRNDLPKIIDDIDDYLGDAT